MVVDPQSISDRLTEFGSSLPADDSLRVSAVLPCLNEERTLGLCIGKIQRALSAAGMIGEIIVADNGSTDRSVEVAKALGARVVHQSVKGYGAALKKGIAAAQGTVVVMADADDSYDWSSITEFVRKIDEGYDFVMGNRFKGGIVPGAMPALHRYIGNPVLSAVARTAFGVRIGDFHCGMRAFRRDVVERMLLTTDGMEFATEMVANAAHQGLRITEIPTRLFPDKRDRPPHLRSFRDGWRHLRFILTYAPDYIYMCPGLAMLLAGLILQTLLARGPVQIGGIYVGIHFLALGAALSLTGFNVINLGVLAKAVMSRRYDGLRSRIIDLLSKGFSLESGLGIGLTMIIGGLAIDGVLLKRWLLYPSSSMESSVHGAFVATTCIVLGMNVLFSSFLLNMILGGQRRRD